MLQEAVEHGTRRAGRDRGRVGAPHLAEDLRLAEDHRVEAARDAEQVSHRGASGVMVRVPVDLVGKQAALGAEERLEVGERRALGQDLDAIARR